MSGIISAAAHASCPVSPLMLADRLLTIAQETERAGYADLAARMVGLAFDVLDRPAGLN